MKTFNLDQKNVQFLKLNNIQIKSDNDKSLFKILSSDYNNYSFYKPQNNDLLIDNSSKEKINSYGNELNINSSKPTESMEYISKNLSGNNLTSSQQNDLRYLLTTSREIDLAYPFTFIDLRLENDVTLRCKNGKNINGIIAKNLTIEGSDDKIFGINRLESDYLKIEAGILEQVCTSEDGKLDIASEYNFGIINCTIFNGVNTTIGSTISLNCSILGFLVSGTIHGVYNGNLYLDSSVNSGIIKGDAYFKGSGSLNFGVVTGKAHFAEGSINSGQVGYILV